MCGFFNFNGRLTADGVTAKRTCHVEAKPKRKRRKRRRIYLISQINL